MPRTQAPASSVPNAPDSMPEPPVRDWWVMAGMTVAAVSAAVASFSGLYGLASVAGWPLRLAWLLPLTLDAHAMTSARVWLADSTRSKAARRFARANALGAIAASIAGNAAYHAIGTGLLEVTWPIIVVVGAVPAAVLGLTAHLHALRSRTDPEYASQARSESLPEIRTDSAPPDESERSTDPKPARPTRRRPRTRTDEELLTAARDADARYRETHGRPITRDALRLELRVSGARATDLRRQLASESAKPEKGDDPAQPLADEPREEVRQP